MDARHDQCGNIQFIHPGVGCAEYSDSVRGNSYRAVGGMPHTRHEIPPHLPLCSFLREVEDVISAMKVAKIGLKKAARGSATGLHRPHRPQSDVSQPGAQ